MDRRKFIQNTMLSGAGLYWSSGLSNPTHTRFENSVLKTPINSPTVLCTWRFPNASAAAAKVLEENGDALDAAIAGAAVEEANLKNTTVGKGGDPDRTGAVTLDACVMDYNGNCGAVACVENITHVAALAKQVMLNSPHVMLVGKGAEDFAYSQGFKTDTLLTKEGHLKWQNWLKTQDYKPIINIENHDTIGILTQDKNGHIAGACSTSGLSYKMKGRVGDSPIIGSGLFIDNNVGGAVATGLGEEVMKTVGSFLIVELMRQGLSPQAACKEAISRIIAANPNYKTFQVAYIALNKNGQTGSYCIHPGFSYMHYHNKNNENKIADAHLSK